MADAEKWTMDDSDWPIIINGPETEDGPDCVASVHNGVEGHLSCYYPREQAIAHAKLIAAAPDLLEACKMALPWLTDEGGDGEPLAHEAVEAAIAKATA